MKYAIDYELDNTLATIDALLSDRDYSTVPTNAATAGWFLWSAMAAAGEWA